MKIMVLLWSTSVAKESNTVPSLFFSHFLGLLFFMAFPFLGPSLFYGLSFLFIPHLGQCSNNDNHHTFIYLQHNNYNSILRTKYDSIWMPLVVYRDMQWIKSDMYERITKVALPQIRCQLHDHASNMTMMERVTIN